MEALNESVVQNEHDRCGIPSNLGVPEEHLANVADITNLGVSKAELPDDQRCVEYKAGLNGGQDETWDEAENRVRVWERHDGQADVLREEKRSSLVRILLASLPKIIGIVIVP